MSFTILSPSFHQSLACLFHQSFTSLSPSFHHPFTSLSPSFHQSFTILSPVFHQSLACLSLLIFTKTNFYIIEVNEKKDGVLRFVCLVVSFSSRGVCDSATTRPHMTWAFPIPTPSILIKETSQTYFCFWHCSKLFYYDRKWLLD